MASIRFNTRDKLLTIQSFQKLTLVSFIVRVLRILRVNVDMSTLCDSIFINKLVYHAYGCDVVGLQ